MPCRGSAWARLRTEDRRISVALTADRDRYEPGARATVAVRTVGRDGRPVRASVLVRGVDEKLVAMGAAGFADPLELLHRQLPVGLLRNPVVSHAVRLPERWGQGLDTTGDGRSTASRTPSRCRWSPRGADGRATVTFDLPDDITSWSVAATAMTARPPRRVGVDPPARRAAVLRRRHDRPRVPGRRSGRHPAARLRLGPRGGRRRSASPSPRDARDGARDGRRHGLRGGPRRPAGAHDRDPPGHDRRDLDGRHRPPDERRSGSSRAGLPRATARRSRSRAR